MTNTLTADLKNTAGQLGADLVGIGDLNRFDGAPKEWDPRYIFPDAKALICLAFRIPRGTFRGNEEGTNFYQYPAMAYANINEVHAPAVLHRLAGKIEDMGYEAVPYRNVGSSGPISDMTGTTEESADLGRKVRYTKPVREGQPAPDVFFHFRIAAFICGLGEIGYSKVFLTPEFGPRQRFAFMFTDAPLEPDPIYDGPQLCDRCMSCVSECPGALSADESVKINVAGREIEWSKLDEWYCFYAYSFSPEVNPFLPDEFFDKFENGREIKNGTAKPTPQQVRQIQQAGGLQYRKPSGYLPACCAGRGCIRACMDHLETRGVLKNKFKSKFRKRKPWWQ